MAHGQIHLSQESNERGDRGTLRHEVKAAGDGAAEKVAELHTDRDGELI
jgi:hypothetical protein